MNSRKDHVALYWSAIVIALVLAACQVTSQQPTVSSGPTAPVASPVETLPPKEMIDLRFACPQWYIPEIKVLAEAFQEAHPHIRIEFTAVEDMLEPNGVVSDPVKLWQHIASSADVGLWSMWASTSRLGLIRDLAPFIQSDASFDRDDFYPFALEYFQWDEGVWGLPAQIIPKVVVYNRDAFDQACLPYPRPGWDQDEFLRLAQQLTIRDGENVTQYGFASTDLVFLPMMKGIVTGGPFDYPELDNPEVAIELRWYTDLVLHGVTQAEGHFVVVTPGSSTGKETLINQGRVAMWTNYLPNVDSHRRAGFNVGIAPYPLGEHDANLFSLPIAYFMSSATAYPQESWLWMKFLTEHRWWRMLPTVMSPRQSVMERTDYWVQWTEEEAATLHFALEHPLGEPWGKINVAMRRAADVALQGQPADEALAEAQQEVLEEYLENAEITPVAIDMMPLASGSADILKLTFASQGFDNTAYAKLADAYNAGQDTYQVEVVAPQSGQTVDCFLGPSGVAQGLGTARALDVQPFVEAGNTFSEDDFAFLDSVRSHGSLYGIPAYAIAPVLFYDPSLFNAADLSYPQPDWTPSDFLHAARVLTTGDGDKKQYGFVPLDGDASILPLFVAAQGAELWDAEGQPHFDAPEVVEAVRWYADLALEHGVMLTSPDGLPYPTTADLAQRQVLVQQGRVAMWTDLIGLGQQPANESVEMAPLPGERALLIPYGFFIAADTQNAAGCWDWLVYAAMNPALELGIPAHRPTLTSDAFAAHVGPDVASTYRALVNYEPVTQPAGSEAQRLALLEALAEIYRGTDPQAALSEAQHNIQSP